MALVIGNQVVDWNELQEVGNIISYHIISYHIISYHMFTCQNRHDLPS